MRAAPAFQISLTRFGVWRSGIAGLGLLGLVVLGAWWVASERRAWVDGTSLVAAFAIVALACSLLRVPPVALNWDGQTWWIRSPDHAVDAARIGHLQVLVDLGPWMLLRFMPDGASPRQAIWLPAQARGIESQWHALRCAVHAPHAARAPAGSE